MRKWSEKKKKVKKIKKKKEEIVLGVLLPLKSLNFGLDQTMLARSLRRLLLTRLWRSWASSKSFIYIYNYLIVMRIIMLIMTLVSSNLIFESTISEAKSLSTLPGLHMTVKGRKSC